MKPRITLALLIFAATALQADEGADLFAPDNLLAWCIVPFDAKQRTPEERAEMVHRLGISKVAYDWRAEHVPTFEREILAYKERGIEFFAFWDMHEEAFRLFEKYNMHPQVWVVAPHVDAPTQEERVRKAAELLLPAVERTRKAGCPLGLYNHGGWGGEPENLAAVCHELRENHNADHVGIVYNFHHAHSRIADFPAALEHVKPYLLCLNINGMDRDGESRGRKILTLAQGKEELGMLRAVLNSGWRGPVGILCHRTDADAQQVLADNLDGLAWLRKELLHPGSAGPKPAPRAPVP